jgi:hypothetical protein
MDLLFSALGVIGSICCVGMFFLIGQGKVKSDQILYYVINGMGGLLILVATLYSFDGGDLGAVLQELCWVAISVMGILKIIKVKKNA